MKDKRNHPTCRQCREFRHCMQASQMYPCTDFKPRQRNRQMTIFDWVGVSALMIGTFGGMIVVSILQAGAI